MRKIIFLFSFLLLVITLAFSASALEITVIDPLYLTEYGSDGALAIDLDHDRETALEDIGFYLITYSAQGPNDYPSNGYVQSLLYEGDKGSVVLVVRRHGSSSYYYDIYLYGEADAAFSDAEVDRVLDAPNVYTNLKRGDVEAGAPYFFSLCAEILSEHYADEAARAARAPLMALIFGLMSGLLAAGASVLGVVLFYRKKRHGESYPLDRYARLNLTDREDRFVGSYITRVRIQSSSSGGGSRGGGGGGGRRGGR